MDEGFKELKSSPIYAMSLGSHELFHSNFWAWMMDEYRKSIKSVFGIDVDYDKKINIKREYKHFDISIINEDGIYIIENKFKSMPYESQLVSYEQAVRNFKSGTLICIKKSNVDNWKCMAPTGNWHCTTYDEILDKMNAFAEDSDNKVNQFHKDIIKEYVVVTKKLLKIIENASASSCDKFRLSSGCYTKYEELRLSDILRKLNAEQFLTSCQKGIEEEIEKIENGYSLYIGAGYSNKNAILDFFLVKQKDGADLYSAVKKAKYEYMIGVQIQGDQYRRIFSSTSGTIEENFNKLAELKWFDASYKDQNDKTIFDKPTKMRNKYNKYNTDKYRFAYQYYNLDSESTFESVKETVVDDLKQAIDIFNKI